MNHKFIKPMFPIAAMVKVDHGPASYNGQVVGCLRGANESGWFYMIQESTGEVSEVPETCLYAQGA